MTTTRGCALVVGLSTALAPLAAFAFEARDTARIGPAGSGQVGVFNPLVFVPRAGLEVATHPFFALIAPHAQTRLRLLDAPDQPLAVSATAGLGLPSAAFDWAPPFGLRGYFSPSCKVVGDDPARSPEDCQRPGLVLAPSLGAQATYGRESALTATVDATYGFVLSGRRTEPLDTYAPLELVFAPVFRTYRAHAGVRFDQALGDQWRVATEIHVHRLGEGESDVPRSPWVLSAYLGADWATTPSTRLTAGAMYWNSDQHAVRLVKDRDGYSRYERIRSHDFAPTLDFLWRWGD